MCQGYRHLSLDERIEIEKGLDAGLSAGEIAALLGRATSTVSREIKRGRWLPINESQAYKPYKTTRLGGPWLVISYRASRAQAKASQRQARSHRPYLFGDVLVTIVCDGLRKGWSPAMIAARAGRDGVNVSHESIYRWLYADKARAEQWSPYLVRGHKRRRHKPGRRVHASRIPFRVSIHDRPGLVDDRVEFGHWAGDTVLGAKTEHDGIHTEIERVTRFMMARKVADLTSATTAAAQLAMFTPLPPQAARSVTLDNGSENHRHYELDQLAMPVWFADPYSSWQRGSNEHFNGILRRYLPKGASLADVTNNELADIVNEINNRPLKCLGWDTPAEAFHQLCSNPHHIGALQT